MYVDTIICEKCGDEAIAGQHIQDDLNMNYMDCVCEYCYNLKIQDAQKEYEEEEKRIIYSDECESSLPEWMPVYTKPINT